MHGRDAYATDMKSADSKLKNAPLLAQLGWFIRLRWLAGIVVIFGSYVEIRWLKWYPYSPRGFIIGLFILIYNLALYVLLRRARNLEDNERLLLRMSWVQIFWDIACLTCLTFHMVFASLLLPRALAYAWAGGAIFLFGLGLQLSGVWPHAGRDERLGFVGWALMLLLTVHLTNHITRNLRRQRKQLLKQNRSIRKMTRQLRRHQRALVQHEKMVAMGQMASGITHEIANPLASMDSLLQLMERKPDKIRPDGVATLREQISRIHQIIQQMKNFSHPLQMQRQNVLLNEVVDQSIEMVGFDRRIKRVNLERQLAADMGEVPLVPQALQQVLVNLIINALDAMEGAEQGKLTLRTERRENWALVEVIDTGHGIQPEHMGRLFEPFFTTKPVGKGTGLGLSISYSLVQKLGGSITVKSQPGKGTAFTIRLPVNSREREAAAGGIAAGENQGL